MSHVFISYKRTATDTAFAREVETQLLNANFEVWRDEKIQGGKKWLEEIESNIRGSFAVVVIITPEAMKSKWVNYEWIFARGAGIAIVPIYFRPVRKFNYRFDDYQFIPFQFIYDWKKLTTTLNEVRNEYSSRLGISIGGANQLKQIIDALNSWDRDDREKAARLLGEQRKHEAVEALIQVVENDSDDRVRITAISSLGSIGDPRAIFRLSSALEEKNWVIRYCAAKALRLIRSPDSVPALIKALDDENGRVRDTVASSIIEIADLQYVPILVSNIRSDSVNLRKTSAWILGGLKVRSALPVLRELIRDTDSGVRAHAIGALGEIGNQTVVADLTQQLSDQASFTSIAGEPILSMSVADVVARALVQIGTPEALEAVERWKKEEGVKGY